MNENNTVIFPVGYHKFHKEQVYNFHLNRWYSFGFARFDDMQEAGKNINSFKDWKNEMIRLADIAAKEKRYLNAAIYYRSAEFYILKKDSEKENLYTKFTEFFYKAVENENFERYKIPYKGSFLPALKLSPVGPKKGTIVMHGGFDSFIEEWYFMMKYLSEHGYEIIGFEGPGQGAALKTYGIPFDLEWEKPVGAVLDFFNLNNITLLGLSMGGWYCLRAAAWEPRIARVIASGHSIDYMKSLPKILYDMHIFFIKKFPDYTNKMIEKSIREEKGMQAWMIGNLMYITQKENPIDAFDIFLQLNKENLHSELIKQDVLYLTGKEDHFVPFKMHKLQVEALTNANSLTDIVFTKETHAQNHCQIGNIKLSLDTMLNWIDSKSTT
ncbi:MAG: alpha/beta hydrolase [Spirochaetales bacterium]|nr:alpha/beta hydrolase [Spirochaetales bacterium]